MKCLIDNQLPLALARFLTSRGVEAIHVTEVGLAEARDRDVWNYVLEHGYVLVTKDDDFLNLSSQSSCGQFVWVRLGNCRTPELLQAFERVWSGAEACLNKGDRVVEIR
ncbi:MAG: hypothetical protein A3J28_10200 [Acidobacteria bacterium RIFCSPLOWO2_12_FULL_60_22]|nr:MAG: hypothetical protein A3J28_10200 [Acidobacteria bacterium RIFCSPLOWO2_12_FULL_60_22]